MVLQFMSCDLIVVKGADHDQRVLTNAALHTHAYMHSAFINKQALNLLHFMYKQLLIVNTL